MLLLGLQRGYSPVIHTWRIYGHGKDDVIICTVLLQDLSWYYILYHNSIIAIVSDSLTPWTAAHQASLSSTVSWSLLKFMSTESVMLSNHLILCCPLLLSPSIFLGIGLFSNELTLRIRWPKYCASISASVLPMNIHGWFPLGLTGLSTPKLTSHLCRWRNSKVLCN